MYFLLFYLDSSLNAVSVIVSRSHIALVNQNPQWPIPRYTTLTQHPKGPAFVCLARHKITDVTSLVRDMIFLQNVFYCYFLFNFALQQMGDEYSVYGNCTLLSGDLAIKSFSPCFRSDAQDMIVNRLIYSSS